MATCTRRAAGLSSALKIACLAGLAGSFFWGSGVRAAVDYSTINLPGIVVTGVRSDSSMTDSVVITGSYASGGLTSTALYDGSLQGVISAPISSWHLLTPVFAGQTVTSSTFYGPNTALFDPNLGAGNIRAVGSYKYAEGASGPNFDHGMLYQGPIGSGAWTQIDATSLVGKGTLLNTIAHSTMGDLVVGNYDTSLATGKAFIYNAATGIWTNLNPAGSKSVTAYGIWQDGGSNSTKYTIAGGFSDLTSAGVDEGYLVDYDSSSGTLTHFKAFNYDNMPISSLISHFDGITAIPNGFNLTGEFATVAGDIGGFFASVTTRNDGSFSDAAWTDIDFPGSILTTGNTVVGNTVLGIYVADGATRSYVATVSSSAVPEPGVLTLLSMGLGMLALARIGARARS